VAVAVPAIPNIIFFSFFFIDFLLLFGFALWKESLLFASFFYRLLLAGATPPSTFFT
jgi:hypothetical protein